MVGGRRKRDQKRYKSSGACCCLAILMALSFLLAMLMRPTQTEQIQKTVITNVTSVSNSTSNVTRPLDLVVMIDASGSIGVEDWKKEVRFAGQVIEKMSHAFEANNAGFRAALGQFSTSAYIDVGMTDDNTTRFTHFEAFGADPPSTWAECKHNGKKEWDDMCADDSDYKLCKNNDACIVRRKGFTEIGAALCGPRPEDGERRPEHCGGGALGSLVGADGPPDNFEGGGFVNISDQCNDPRLNTPLKVVLLVTDGQPQAPGICYDAQGKPNPYHCGDVDTPKGAKDAAASAKLIKAAWWEAAGTPQLFGIYVGKSDAAGIDGQSQLKAISSCCDFDDTVLEDGKVACTKMKEDCQYYIYEENFEELLASVSEIVAKLANFETNLCVTTAHSYTPKATTETYEREIPTTQLLWLLLLLIPCIMALCWGWALKAIDHCIAKPPTDEGSLELIDAAEMGDVESPCGGAGAMPGTGTSAMNPRKKGAFASASEPEDEMMTGGSVATVPRKKGAFRQGEDDPDEDPEGGDASDTKGRRQKGGFSRPGEDPDEDEDGEVSYGAAGSRSRPKGSMARPGQDDDVDLMASLPSSGQRLPNGKHSWKSSPKGVVLNFKKPGENGLTIHLETPDGPVAMSLPPQASMNDLKKKIQEETDLEPDEQKLAFDPVGDQPVPDKSSLAGYNIKDGDDLHLLNDLPDNFSGLDSTGKLPDSGLDSTGKLPGPGGDDLSASTPGPTGTTANLLAPPLPGGGGLDLSASKPGPGGTTVNLVTPKGRVPVHLPPNATFEDLEDKVRGLTGLDPGPLKLAFDKAGKEPVTTEPGLTGFDIANGSHLFLKPKANKNPGPLGLEKSAVLPGPQGLDMSARIPGPAGVETGPTMIVEVETENGKTEIELPETATWDQLQKKLRQATGRPEEDPDQWAFDPDGGERLANAHKRLGKHTPLKDFDIEDGAQLLLMDPDLDKLAGLTGTKVSAMQPGLLSKSKKGKQPGEGGVVAGDIHLILKTDKGDVPVTLPANAPFSMLQEKAKEATGIAPDKQRWAFDPEGQKGIDEDPSTALDWMGIVDGTPLHLLNPVNQALVGVDGVLQSKVKMHKLTKKSKSTLGSSKDTAPTAQPLATIEGSFADMGSFQDAEDMDVNGGPRRESVRSQQMGRKSRSPTEGGFGSFDMGEGYSDGPASFAFIIEPKDLSPELQRFAFNPWPVVMLSSALLPAALYLSGMFDGLLGAAGAAA